MKYLTEYELWVTEVSNPIYFILTARFCWTEIAFCPSIRLTSWSLGTQLEKSSSDSWHPQNPSAFHSNAENVRTASVISSFSYFISAQPSLHCLPLLSSLPDSIFFFWFCPHFEHMAAPCCCPSSLPPGLHWPLLISKVLRVSSCSLNNAPRSQSGADRPRAGHLSWSFILLTWVSFDMWGHLWLSGRFEYLWCAHLILIQMGTMGLLYSKRNQMKNTPLASHI